jgi:hypothetical protein
MWAAMGVPPIEMTSFLLELNSNSEVSFIEVKLGEQHIIKLDKPISHCLHYQMPEFNVCSLNFFKERLTNTTNCTLPGKFLTLL